MIDLNINSEVSALKAVLIHQPGPEVENMTPATAERALYSDILNLSVASREYSSFQQVLEKVTRVFHLKDILIEALKNPTAREEITQNLTSFSRNRFLTEQLQGLSIPELATQIIEGIPYAQLSLANFLQKEMYLISPLHNAFYTRDASFIIGNIVFISSMAKRIRVPEALVMKTLFRYSDHFKADITAIRESAPTELYEISIEGGDVLVLNEETLLIGIGSRTSAQAVDVLIKQISSRTLIRNILIQELPDQPESFIHLDMVFTLLSENECMIYKPLILEENKLHTVHIKIEDKKIIGIDYIENLIAGLSSIGNELQPVFCGGLEKKFQEREQWHSGANLFAFEPGKLIAYERNLHTLEALNNRGYRIVKANDFMQENFTAENGKRLVVTIEGSELSRGGGGPRCMTLPLARK